MSEFVGLVMTVTIDVTEAGTEGETRAVRKKRMVKTRERRMVKRRKRRMVKRRKTLIGRRETRVIMSCERGCLKYEECLNIMFAV